MFTEDIQTAGVPDLYHLGDINSSNWFKYLWQPAEDSFRNKYPSLLFQQQGKKTQLEEVKVGLQLMQSWLDETTRGWTGQWGMLWPFFLGMTAVSGWWKQTQSLQNWSDMLDAFVHSRWYMPRIMALCTHVTEVLKDAVVNVCKSRNNFLRMESLQ